MTFFDPEQRAYLRGLLDERIAIAQQSGLELSLRNTPAGASNRVNCAWVRDGRHPLPEDQADWVCEGARAYCSRACLRKLHGWHRMMGNSPTPESYWGCR